ncbi:MAG: FG-GAP-like repeat-containing protein [Planctomycetota bacterium]
MKQILTFSLFSAAASILPAQNTISTLTGPSTSTYFGEAVANAGDVNGDGTNDIIVGARGGPGPNSEPGRVLVFSGRDSHLLFQVDGVAGMNSFFGDAVAGVGDVNGDGKGDILVGDPGGARTAYLYSGASTPGNAILLYSWTGTSIGDGFGYAVAGVGDVNLDGVPDVAVGAPGFGQLSNGQQGFLPGYVQVRSGFDGSLIYTVTGTAARSRFGFAIAALGDINGDNRDDFAIGAPTHTQMAGLFNQGAVRAVSGTSATIFEVRGTAANQGLGFSVAAAGDQNADGTPDLIVGAPYTNTFDGMARVLSGSTGGVIFTYLGTAGSQEQLGVSVDALRNSVFGTPAELLISGPLAGSGRVAVYQGLTLMSNYVGDSAADEFGWGLASLGDINEDGGIDFVAGAHFNGNGYARVMSDQTLTLWSDVHEINYGTGGTQTLTMQVSPAIGATDYWIFASLTGTGPLPVGNGVTLPLTYDAFTGQVIAATNTAMFPGFQGPLSAGGPMSTGVGAVVVPANVPNMLGVTLYFAGLGYESSTSTNLVGTNYVTLRLTLPPVGP